MLEEKLPPPSCVLSKRGREWGGWRRSLPLRLAFQARERGCGVVEGEASPSVVHFEQGRKGVGWLEDKPPPPTCVSSKGGREWGG